MSKTRKREKRAKAQPKKTEGRSERQPRMAPESTQQESPTWTLQHLDFDGPWCCKKADPGTLLRIVERLQALESMTWSEIEGRSSHVVKVTQLAKKARARLANMRQDEVEELFSVRLTGRERIWGIRAGSVLHLLWWDPMHQVCPSHKKHT